MNAFTAKMRLGVLLKDSMMSARSASLRSCSSEHTTAEMWLWVLLKPVVVTRRFFAAAGADMCAGEATVAMCGHRQACLNPTAVMNRNR